MLKNMSLSLPELSRHNFSNSQPDQIPNFRHDFGDFETKGAPNDAQMFHLTNVRMLQLQRISTAILFGLCIARAQIAPSLEDGSLDLNSLNWTVANLNASISFNADSLPFYVLEAMVEKGILKDGDPLTGYNSRNYRWVASETWSISAEFDLEASNLQESKLDLVLEGVDTVADVYINNELAGKCRNAHRQYRFDIQSLVSEGNNLLEFLIYPAPEYAAAQNAEYPITVPAQPYSRGYPFFNFIRKPHSDFGWDWGPAFAPSGIYGSVKIQAYSSAFLTGCSITQEHQDSGTVEVSFRASFQAPKEESGTLTVESDDMKWIGHEEVVLQKEGESFVTVKVTIEDDYELWWPVGFGSQTLYNFTLTYTPDDMNSTSEEMGVRESTLNRRLGIRTIDLVEEPIRDPPGLTFYFRVNGIPVYARGANMIPLQVFHSQNSEEGYREILDDAILANMNMIRVWGGGLYQQDSFYDLCDEMGLLVWQESMFACAQYPINKDFLDNVKAETAYQAQRLYHHASIAIWGGNNEVETSFTWFPESSANTDLFVSNYNKLFVDTIREELLAVDENINFVDSSPSKGIYSLDPYTKRWGNPSAVNSGDVHFYDYNSNCLSLETYPRAKFVSEYGYQSFPSFSVYQKYTEAKDWSILSNMSDYRQNHPDGNGELMNQMKWHFQQIANNATNEAIQKRLFQQWIYLTQLQQSLCYETGITQWRRLKSAPDARTMGVLYWQLNDIWAGPSWSGRDYGGHWKLLMYTIKKIFSPVLISGVYNDTQADALSVYVTNDQPYKVEGTATAEIILFSSRGHDQPFATIKTDFSVDALDNKLVNTTSIKSKLTAKGYNLQEAIVRLSTSASGNPNDIQPQTCISSLDNPFTSACTPAKGVKASSQPDNQTFESSQVVWLTEPKLAAIPTNPIIRLSNFRQLTPNSASFKISCRTVAVGVQLDTDSIEGTLSDNGFLIVPWDEPTLTFTSRENFDVKDLQNSLHVISLADTLSSGTPIGNYNLVY